MIKHNYLIVSERVSVGFGRKLVGRTGARAGLHRKEMSLVTDPNVALCFVVLPLWAVG